MDITGKSMLVVCIDPDDQLWNILRQSPEGILLLERKNIRFTDFASRITPENIIEDFFYRNEPSRFRFRILKNPGIVARLEKPYLDMEKRIAALFRILYGNILITNKFRKLWNINIRKNLQDAGTCYCVNAYKNQFKDEPVLVINAGPSLDRDLGLVRILRNKFRIICVDTALKACLHSGVHPDLVVSLDCQLDNLRDFLGRRKSTSDLFLEISAQPGIRKIHKGRVFLFHTKKHLKNPATGAEEDFVESRYRPFIDTFPNAAGFQTGGSVSATALDIALYAGAAQIIFIGQDLGYTAGKIYCRGTYVEEIRLKQSNRFRTYETILARYAFQVASTQRVEFEGSVWQSTPVLDQYRRWFEEAAAMLEGRLLFYRQPFIRKWGITEKALLAFPDLPEKKVHAEKMDR
jgi:hypothetical protein